MTTLTLEREDGTSFTVTAQRVERGGAPLVLVVPAMGMGARWYRPLLTALNDIGVHAAVTELRGHESAGGRQAGWRYDWGYAELVDDLGHAVEALVDDGLPAPYLLGHSLGGQIACVYAAERPDAVAGLMLVAAGTVHWRRWSVRHLVLTQAAAASAMALGHFPGPRIGFGGREARTEMRDWARFGRTGRLVVGGIDRTASIAALDLPVLAVSFEGDALGIRSSVDGLADLLSSAPVTRVHLDEQVDHLRWARTPEVIVPTLRTWLARQGEPLSS